MMSRAGQILPQRPPRTLTRATLPTRQLLRGPGAALHHPHLHRPTGTRPTRQAEVLSSGPQASLSSLSFSGWPKIFFLLRGARVRGAPPTVKFPAAPQASSASLQLPVAVSSVIGGKGAARVANSPHSVFHNEDPPLQRIVLGAIPRPPLSPFRLRPWVCAGYGSNPLCAQACG